MFEIFDEISKSERIVEWIDPWDARLAQATGRAAPQSGGAGRMSWEVTAKDWPQLASVVKRLIVPETITLDVTAEMDGDEDDNRLILAVPSSEAWSDYFPTNDLTNIMTVRGLKRWAAVALTDNQLALGVFATETNAQDVLAMIQPISEEVTAKLIE